MYIWYNSEKNMNQSKLYRLIVDPEYRIWRHALLIFTLAIITFNQIFIAYQDCASLLGYQIYFICLASFVTYIMATYINYFLLIPKLLMKEKYIRYIVFLLIVVFFLLFVNIFMEYEIRTFLELPHRIKSYTNPLILVDSLSSSMITIICFWSMSAISLFRRLSKKNEDIVKLEHEFLQSQINKLKGQASPAFLSKALQKASNSAESDAQRASKILMQLGQLLRYQLYDCDREKVLLSSEINFMEGFLKLRELVSDCDFVYSIETTGKVNNILISPLLLIVFVQSILEKDEVTHLAISISIIDNKVIFDCDFTDNYVLKDNDVWEVKERLNALYPNLYKLDIESGKVQLQLSIK